MLPYKYDLNDFEINKNNQKIVDFKNNQENISS